MSEFKYQPREQFVEFHQRTQRNSVLVCHRRMGKTVACVGDLIVRALHTQKKNARFAYIAPYRSQAKEIAWSYLKDMTEGLREGYPRESDLKINLVNGATIQIFGADNPNSIRGLFLDGAVIDEFADIKPSLMGEVILPCLADRKGFLVLMGTPKGRNQFYDYAQMAEGSEDWFFMCARASETGIIDEPELERMREAMGEDQYQQELECSFDAALPGTFYADLINTIDERGQLVHESLFDPEMPVSVAADVGLVDSTAWWFWQPRPDGVAIIDFYQANGMHVDHYLEVLARKPYNYDAIWLPHDAKAKTLATRRSTVEQFRYPGEVRPDLYEPGSVLPVKMTPKLSIQHGIDAARFMLPKCWFDAEKCAEGLDALRSYRRQWHEHLKQFSNTPMHDWSSHAADAFRYMALNARVGDSEPVEPVAPKVPQPAFEAEKLTLNGLWSARDANRPLRASRI